MREGWKYQKLGELVKVINGLWVGKKPPFTNVAVVRNANFTKSCTLDMSNIAYIDVEEKQFNTRELQYADIIIEKSGGSEKQPVGRPVFFNIKDRGYSFSNFTATLRVVSSDIVPEYLYKVLLAQYKQGVTKRLQSKTTGLHNLDFKSYLKSVIPIPSCEKQLSIVSELDKINELIRLKKEQLKDYDNLAQSIFYEMFGDPVVNEKGWELKKLGEEYKVSSSKRIMQDEWTTEGVPFLKVSDVVSKINGQNSEPSTFISETTYSKLVDSNAVPVQNDILITSRGTLGLCYIVKNEDRFYFQDGMITWLAECKGNITPLFLTYLFKNHHFLQQITSKANKSTVAYISISQISKRKIPFPPLALQNLFAQRIELIEQQKAEIQNTIADLETLLASRMQYWFD